MKKLLLILLCVPLLFSCGEETDNLQRELTKEDINGRYTGKGTVYNHTENIKIIGEFRDGLMHGEVTIIYSDRTFAGTFIDGMRNGIGTYTYDDGTVFEGLWVSDKIIGTLKERRKETKQITK